MATTSLLVALGVAAACSSSHVVGDAGAAGDAAASPDAGAADAGEPCGTGTCAPGLVCCTPSDCPGAAAVCVEGDSIAACPSLHCAHDAGPADPGLGSCASGVDCRSVDACTICAAPYAYALCVSGTCRCACTLDAGTP